MILFRKTGEGVGKLEIRRNARTLFQAPLFQSFDPGTARNAGESRRGRSRSALSRTWWR